MRKQYSAEFKARVVLEMLQETKSISELASEYDVHPNMLYKWRRLALEKLPAVFSAEDDVTKLKAKHDKEVDELYQQIGQLATQVSWFKKKVSGLSRAERLQLIDWPDSDESSVHSIRAQAQLLDLNRSDLYYRPKVSAQEIALKHRVNELYTR